jgi:hypothetical protein
MRNIAFAQMFAHRHASLACPDHKRFYFLNQFPPFSFFQWRINATQGRL